MEPYERNNLIITSNWLLGFVEGEGTFGFKSLVPYFQIAQNAKDEIILSSIKQYLESFKSLPNSNLSSIQPNMIKILNKNTNVLSYVISDLDVLHQIIVPFFSQLQFKTRKLIDFNFWVIAIKLHIYGYYLIPEGKSLLLKISQCTNKQRYGKDDINNSFLQEEIENIFKIEPPFDLNLGKSHTLLAQEYSRKRGSRLGFEVYVYKNDNYMGKFSSYNEAQKQLNLKSNKTISRLIDTDKASKLEGYKFYSSKK